MRMMRSKEGIHILRWREEKKWEEERRGKKGREYFPWFWEVQQGNKEWS
jgi:hypothetical protein